VKALREEKVYQRNDERILGDGEFVGRLLASAEEAMERRYALPEPVVLTWPSLPLGYRRSWA